MSIAVLSDTAAAIPWHTRLWTQLQETVTQDRVPHALLILGARGMGKSILAHRFAAMLLCKAEGQQDKPCGVCKSCHQLATTVNPNLRVYEPEEPGKQLKVDTIRELIAQSTLAIEQGTYCVNIIKSAGSMNAASANALLKTLEEPVAGLVLILIAESASQLPATILSRVQKLMIAAPTYQVAKQWLTEQQPDSDVDRSLNIAQGAPLFAMELADGELPDAYQAFLDEFLAVADGRLAAEKVSGQWIKSPGLDILLGFLLSWIDNLIRLANCSSEAAIEAVFSHQRLKTLAERIDLKTLFSFRDEILMSKLQQRNNLNPQLVLDHLFIQWAKINLK